MSNIDNSPKTNVIWIVPRDYFCTECGYAITKPTRQISEYYSESTAYHNGSGYQHKLCPGHPALEKFFPPLAKRAEPSEFGKRAEMKEADEES